MHYQVTGQRIICGGYQLFTASGFGKTEHEAIADALATHPDRAAWQPHELRAEVDPINLPTVESGLNLPIRSRHHLHHAATKTATRGAIVVGLALAIESATKAADGGQPISPRTTGLDQTTGPAWVVIGADDPSPRRITGSARGESFSAGVGVVSVSGAGLKPPATSTGPADSISVASRKDETRSLAVAARSSLGLQPHEGNDGAVGNLGTDHSRQLPPTEFNVHPSTGFSSPAGVPSRVGGVGNGNATANDTPNPRAIAGGGAISSQWLAWLAKTFAVSSVILTGISAISAVMLAGRLEEE